MALVCEHVGVSLQDSSHVLLTDVSLSVEAGQVVGVAGRSGAGKSTLLRCLSGAQLPDVGRVCVDDLELGGAGGSRRAFAERVALVGQLPERQLFATSVAEDVAFGPRQLGLSDDEVAARVEWALALVGLDAVLVGERSPFALSGGERRRVAIAGMLALQTPYLLLDEPTAGLDPGERDRLLACVRELAASGVGVVLVSHDVETLAKLSDDVLLLDKGVCVAYGSARSVLVDTRALAACGLEMPFAARMAERLTERGVGLPAGILTSEELADALLALRARGGEAS